MKHFINLKDISSKDLRKIIVDAKNRKRLRKKLSTLEVDKGSPLKGKILIQMFEKPSSRTRISFYLAIKQLGGGTLTLRSNELHLGQGGESITDTAKVLSTYGDGFMLRTDSEKKMEDFKKYLSKTKKPFMAKFYKEKRERLNILLNKDGTPEGGKWSFD